MEVCDKCGTPTTRTKNITSKKNGTTYLVYECVGGCMNGKYNYTFFPKKKFPDSVPFATKVTPTHLPVDGDSLSTISASVRKIELTLNMICNELLKKKEEEIDVDETPF